MKLKDILKTDTNKIGWLKVFKKLGADNETMKFVNDNVGKESSGGGSSKYSPRYFNIDFEKANVDWGKIMTISGNFVVFKIAATYKYFTGLYYIINAYGYVETDNSDPYSFSYIPLYVSQDIINLLELNNVQEGFKSLEEIIQIINIISPKIDLSIDLSMEGITEITEEEFYKID